MNSRISNSGLRLRGVLRETGLDMINSAEASFDGGWPLWFSRINPGFLSKSSSAGEPICGLLEYRHTCPPKLNLGLSGGDVEALLSTKMEAIGSLIHHFWPKQTEINRNKAICDLTGNFENCRCKIS